MNEQKRAALTNTETWQKATPQKLPKPTYYPLFMAIAFAFMLWGILASWLISAAGVIILIIALSGWIRILRSESNGRK